MSGVNKVIAIGNLGRDPEIKHFESNAVANFSIGVSEKYNDRTGNTVESTEWLDCEVWGKLSEIVEKYVSKGDRLYIEGKIKSDTWKDEQGNSRKKTKILVLNLQMLGGKKDTPIQPSLPLQSAPVQTEEDDDFPW